MLFNSYLFIFIFLPLSLGGFFLLNAFLLRIQSIYWLILTSLFFYGYWNPSYLLLIISSIFINYTLGICISHRPLYFLSKKSLLICGIAFNLGLIAYFKYTDFLIVNINSLLQTNIDPQNIILPLAISFFTFQQISYLVDIYKAPIHQPKFVEYVLFVLFFPQLIAGPIIQHKDIIPQFKKKFFFVFQHKNIAIGMSLFLIGLFKKVVIADQCALYASPIFQAAESGTALTFAESWFGAFAYTFQLYFDFSGYSDMAIGLGRMFNLNLPINFNSPYKAVNIIDFWRRWHITLSYFLRSYLYIPLGGNRTGPLRQKFNIFITMLLGGLWHGANWTYILWGALHGIFIIINHLWQDFRTKILKQNIKQSSWQSIFISRTITFLCVCIAWVTFRADSIYSAKQMLKAMFGFNGISLLHSFERYFNVQNSWLAYFNIRFDGLFYNLNFDYKQATLILFCIALITFMAPNSTSLFHIHRIGTKIYPSDKTAQKILMWSPSIAWTILMSFIGVISILYVSRASEFLYFQF